MEQTTGINAEVIPEIALDDFCRRFSMRRGNVMWMLGAGASSSAGIPTATDMIWEFKQKLFVSQRKISLHAVSDLSSQTVREQLQAFIDSSGKLPSINTPEEYADLFEAVYPAEADRRTYLDSKLSGAKVSFTHLALATLMHAGVTRIVWTTNFDTLVADACAKVYGTTGNLTSVALDGPDLARQSINEERWPIEIKLHGDYRSRKLKNTSDELRLQDERFRSVFVDSCCRYGLIVAGYSGRDSSIMDTLESVLTKDSPFPAGLFWLHRGDASPSARVVQLLKRAAAAKVEVALVKIINLDEALRDMLRLQSGIHTTALDSFAADRRRWSAAPKPLGKTAWPIVSLNALEVAQAPTVCRRVVAPVGGYTEVRDAIQLAGANILFARRQIGVLGFGTDREFRKTFEPYGITTFDLHTIELKRLRYESSERGLLREAMTRAITNHHALKAVRRRNVDLLFPTNPKDEMWSKLSEQVGQLTGTVPGFADLQWREGLAVRLEWADERLWLLLEPRTVFEGITVESRAAATDFARERTVKRYNRQLFNLVEFWADLLASKGEELRAFNIGDGVDAVFVLSKDPAFSRRVGP